MGYSLSLGKHRKKEIDENGSNLGYATYHRDYTMSAL
jgi:hypothetical protein